MPFILIVFSHSAQVYVSTRVVKRWVKLTRVRRTRSPLPSVKRGDNGFWRIRKGGSSLFLVKPIPKTTHLLRQFRLRKLTELTRYAMNARVARTNRRWLIDELGQNSNNLGDFLEWMDRSWSFASKNDCAYKSYPFYRQWLIHEITLK
jgi:hypothetical protein